MTPGDRGALAASPLLFLVSRDLYVLHPGEDVPRRLRLSPEGGHEGRELLLPLLALLRGEAPRSGLGNVVGPLSALRDGGPVQVADPGARAIAEALGLRVLEARSRVVAEARERLPPEVWEPDRELLLSAAEVGLEERLSSPEEVIITLSREGDRLERLLRKENEALGALSAAAGKETPVAEYAAHAGEHVRSLEVRYRELTQALEEATLRKLPNASAVIGPRTAARLLSLAGSPTALLHLNASRVQVLGARRRKPGSPGPRHGVLYSAEGMDRVPPSRRGALARSLASWTVVALRADLLTEGSVGAELAERRERRLESLSHGRAVSRAPRPEPEPRRTAAEPRARPSGRGERFERRPPREERGPPRPPGREPPSRWQRRGRPRR